MRKRWGLPLAVLGSMFLLLAGLYVTAHNYLSSDHFQKRIIQELNHSTDCDVHLDKISRHLAYKAHFEDWKIRILAGVDLEGIRIARDDFHPREFLKASQLRLRYDLLEALLHQKVILEEMRIDSPTIQLDLQEPTPSPTSHSHPQIKPGPPEEKNPINQQAPLSTEKPTSSGIAVEEVRPTKKMTIASDDGLLWPAPPSLDLRSLTIENGTLLMSLPDHEKLALRGVQILGAFSSDPIPGVGGTISCENADLPSGIKLDGAKASFFWRKDSISVPKWNADVFGGTLDGKFKADQTKREIPYETSFSVTNLNVEEFTKILGIKSGEVRGRLQVQSHFQGSLANPQLSSGEGQLHIQQGHLVDFPGLILMGGFLNRPDFRDLPLQKFEVDFTFRSGTLNIPRMEGISSDLQLTASGWVNLIEQNQDFRLKLAISGALARKFPPSILDTLNRRLDGYYEIPFHIWGNLDHPQNDIQQKFDEIAAQAIGGAIFDKIFQAIPAH